MTTQTARICIIGAGISGIAAGKFLKEKGLAYDCFEASSVLGGNWVFKNPNGISTSLPRSRTGHRTSRSSTRSRNWPR
jgi:cation diffusion facilitator CzcD-associated flavoprotein CzcO